MTTGPLRSEGGTSALIIIQTRLSTLHQSSTFSGTRSLGIIFDIELLAERRAFKERPRVDTEVNFVDLEKNSDIL